jgi:hypothetical protein
MITDVEAGLMVKRRILSIDLTGMALLWNSDRGKSSPPLDLLAIINMFFQSLIFNKRQEASTIVGFKIPSNSCNRPWI